MSDAASTSLRDLLARERPVVLPGVGTALEARLAEAAGFEAVYVSGYATAAAVHGVPDVGLIALGEMSANARLVTASVTMPVVADADTGYGDVHNAAHAVRALAAAGVAGIQLEDQQWPKRCGHLSGKTVETADAMLRKLEAALAARAHHDIVVIARTDARAPLGLDEALARGRMYHEAGADAVFVDAPEAVEEMVAVGEGIPGPLVINMSEGGRTPLLSADELGALGFKLILFPTSALRVSARAVERFFADLRQAGDSRPWRADMMSLDELNQVVGLGELEDFEAQVLAPGAARGRP